MLLYIYKNKSIENFIVFYKFFFIYIIDIGTKTYTKISTYIRNKIFIVLDNRFAFNTLSNYLNLAINC